MVTIENGNSNSEKSNKWMRGLSIYLVKKILDLNPVSISYEVENPRVLCKIIDNGGNIGHGLAICSTIDKFEEKEGKNKAAGRAVAALVNKTDSCPIRNEWKLFPDSWTKRHIWRVLEHSMFKHKSTYDVGV